MKPARTALYTLDSIIIALVLCLPVLWLMDRIRIEALGFSMSWGLRPFVGLALLLIVRAVIAARMRGRDNACAAWLGRACVKKGLLSFSILILALPILDRVLAAKGYEREALPIVLQGDEDWTDSDARFEADPNLLWRFKPGTSIHGQPVNSLGFPEREVNPVKMRGTTRVICLGDSCTADGVPPYSTILHGLLTNAPPDDGRWEAFHNGVHGYSVLQGLEQFRHTTRQLKPNIVTIYFGWNAHWKGQHTDAEQFRMRRAGPVVRAMRGLYRSTRDQERQLRVTAGEYETALTTLVREIRASGATPVMITAPRAASLSRVIAERQGDPLEEVHALHDRYVELTRKVAAAQDVKLIDAARLVEDHPARHTLFRADGIHLRLAGREELARQIYKAIVHAVSQQRRKNSDPREWFPPAHELLGGPGR